MRVILLRLNQNNIANLQLKNPEPRPDLLPLIAAVLRLQTGTCDALCYGIGESSELAERQQEFLKCLRQSLQKITAPGAVIHLHGNSLGSLVSSLQADRIEATWSCPQYSLLGPDAQADRSISESLPQLPTGQVPELDNLVLEGSVCYLDQLSLLSRARELLRDDACLTLFGENIRDDSRIEYSRLANLSSLQQLAERLGFELLEEQDYSNDALESIEHLRAYVAGQSKSVREYLKLADEEYQSLIAEIDYIANEFKTGRRCFQLFVFRKLAQPTGEYAGAEYGDIDSFDPPEIAGLFEASFGVGFDPELWDWKYKQVDGVCVVARAEPGGDIVAHYGGAPRQINYFGEPAWALQSCDVMVLPEMRRQYGHNSLFFKTAATFLEREEGNTVNHLLGFGFPNQKAMNIALRLGLYEKTDDFVEVSFPGAVADNSCHDIEMASMDNPEHCQSIDDLWRAMNKQFGEAIIGVRDSQYIRYRYFNHPFAARGLYRSLILRDKSSGAALSFFVLKNHDGGQLLMDMVCDSENIALTVAAAKEFVSEDTASSDLRFWVTRAWQEKLLPDAAVKEIGIEIPCNSWNPGPSSELLKGAWWLTAGDMDFI